MDVLEGQGEGPLDWEAFFDHLPEFEVDDFLLQEDPPAPVPGPLSVADAPSPNPVLSEIENLLMDDSADGDVLPGTPSSDSDYDKLLAEILVEPRPDQSEEGSTPSDRDRVDPDPPTPEEATHEPISKTQIR